MFLDLGFRVHGRASCDRRKNGFNKGTLLFRKVQT